MSQRKLGKLVVLPLATKTKHWKNITLFFLNVRLWELFVQLIGFYLYIFKIIINNQQSSAAGGAAAEAAAAAGAAALSEFVHAQ